MQTILIVEDDAPIAELISWVLDDAGFSVRSARTMSEALRAYDDCKPAMVIADLVLPDGFGSELLSQIHERDGGHAVASVVMSAHPRARELAASAGADACLCKPFDLDEFFSTVERLLERDDQDGVYSISSWACCRQL